MRALYQSTGCRKGLMLRDRRGAPIVSKHEAGLTGQAAPSNGKVPRLGLDGDPLEFGELLDPCPAAETAIAGSLGAAERHLRLIMHGRAVDMRDPGLQPLGDVEASRNVAREHGSREPVFRIVGDL